MSPPRLIVTDRRIVLQCKVVSVWNEVEFGCSARTHDDGLSAGIWVISGDDDDCNTDDDDPSVIGRQNKPMFTVGTTIRGVQTNGGRLSPSPVTTTTTTRQPPRPSPPPLYRDTTKPPSSPESGCYIIGAVAPCEHKSNTFDEVDCSSADRVFGVTLEVFHCCVLK